MDVRQLRYALAVVDHGSFTAAAAACHVAQPSLSQAVRTLERELGAELFLRLGRTVRLTAAGEAFVPAARQALHAVDEVGDEVRAVTGLLAGRLDLVALPSLALDPVAALVSRFHRAHPGVTVRLAHPDGTDDLAASVRSGLADVGITDAPTAAGGLLSVALERQEIVAVLPPGERVRRTITPAQLAQLPLITQPPGTSTRTLLDAMCAAGGATPAIAVETDQREAIVPLVLDGAGAALLPRPMAVRARRDGARVVPLDPPLVRELSLVHRSSPSPAARAFIELALSRPG